VRSYIVRTQTRLPEDLDSHAFIRQFDQAEQKVLGPEAIVVQPFSFLARKEEHALRSWRKLVSFVHRMI
jgi:hypothetical protein